MSFSRRQFLCALPVFGSSSLLFVSPPSQAFPWLAAAQFAISAAGAFTKSDGGMGAYLGALKQLTEENIRLSQEVLLQVGKLQQQLALMPTVMAEAFITNNEYIIREGLQGAIDNMAFVNYGENLSLSDRALLESILATCTGLASKRSLPYGKRGVAAACAPLAAALDIHARKLLGRSHEIPYALRTFYIDWFNNILDFNSVDSLAGLLVQQGKVTGATVSTQLNNIAKESETLARVLETVYQNGIGTELENTEIACWRFDVAHQKDVCSAIAESHGEVAAGICMSRVAAMTPAPKRVLVAISNQLSSIEGAKRPVLKITVGADDSDACSSGITLVKTEPQDYAVAFSAKKSAVEKASLQAIEVIDRDRAILAALYQLYQDATDARRLLINRLALGGI